MWGKGPLSRVCATKACPDGECRPQHPPHRQPLSVDPASARLMPDEDNSLPSGLCTK